MLGAIIGDIVGSVWEFHRIRTKHFQLFGEKNGITDDSILTVAVADALLHDRDPAEALRDWARKVKPGRHVAGYGKRFINWVAAPTVQPPYGSFGNGGAMRVSPAAFLATSLEDCLDKARRVTEVTHNHPEGMKGALATAHAIWLARQGEPAAAIRLAIAETYGYDMSRTVDEIRAVHVYNETAAGCVPEALTCALEATDFEDAIRNAVSLGGDSDTLASIAGGVAEALYGIPQDIVKRAWTFIPPEMRELIQKMYESGRGRDVEVDRYRALREIFKHAHEFRTDDETKSPDSRPDEQTQRHDMNDNSFKDLLPPVLHWLDNGAIPSHSIPIVRHVLSHLDQFVRWPQRARLLWDGCIRKKKEERYTYPEHIRQEASACWFDVDGRSNGPAILAYQLSGGGRPPRLGKNHGWTIHHVYDGNNPWEGRNRSAHAVKDGQLFTHSGGLVAIDPIADAMASEYALVAWVLRHQCYQRLGFDPDEVFSQPKGNQLSPLP